MVVTVLLLEVVAVVVVVVKVSCSGKKFGSSC